jgi:hypothetical protein
MSIQSIVLGAMLPPASIALIGIFVWLMGALNVDKLQFMIGYASSIALLVISALIAVAVWSP